MAGHTLTAGRAGGPGAGAEWSREGAEQSELRAQLLSVPRPGQRGTNDVTAALKKKKKNFINSIANTAAFTVRSNTVHSSSAHEVKFMGCRRAEFNEQNHENIFNQSSTNKVKINF